jgi:arylsulfatase A-like enzyme
MIAVWLGKSQSQPMKLWPVPLLLLAFVYAQAGDRPNILWITSEDNGPQLGCYGDAYAHTPNLDQLAAKGMIYLNVWSVAPVCAPARTAIISGMYPSSTGAEHMRSMVPMPAGCRMYPQLLREAGYYCSNNSKEDYNLEKAGKVWDDSSNKAHWKNRQPGQPFFAVFNHTVTHESQIRKRPHTLKHDPAKVRVPAYHPDTPEVRQDWAQYYDKITEMDELAGRNLRELEAAGLADDTIIFYYGDHGAGMPRSKRSACNSGLHVPLIVYVPEKYRHLAPKDYKPGGRSNRLVSFVDLAPTVLSIAGMKPPKWMQGHAFMGEHAVASPKYLHGLRGRMDERYDLVRSVRDERYVYIRNYMPHKVYGQHIAYMFETPTTCVWKDLYDQGKLKPPQTFFWERKPPEELYDLQRDPDEVKNLAGSPKHQRILKRMRGEQEKHAMRIVDIGFLPEAVLHSPFAGEWAMPLIIETAGLAASGRMSDLPQLRQRLEGDSVVAFWASLGLLMRGPSATAQCHSDLVRALTHVSPYVSINAAQALVQLGDQKRLEVLREASDDYYVRLWALNAVDELGTKADPIREAVLANYASKIQVDARVAEYVPRLLESIKH